MIRNTRWVVSILTGLLLATSFSKVEARPVRIPFEAVFGGTSLTIDMDLFPVGAPDGTKAAQSTLSINGILGLLGPLTSQAVVETIPQAPTQACPGGVFIIDITNPNNPKGFGVSTSTFPNGDQLYGRTLTRTQCNNTQGGFTGFDTAEILGGTGQFAEASGTVTLTYEGFTWVFDNNVKQGFFSLSGTLKGTLFLPK